MSISIVFADDVGKIMVNTELPKQFMEIVENPIIIHILEIFKKAKKW